MQENCCPVCGQVCEEDAPYCMRCGWEISSPLAVGKISAEEERVNQERLAIARRNWKQIACLEKRESISPFVDNVMSVLPGPFEWCEIPEKCNFQMVDDKDVLVGTFDIAPFLLAKYPITNSQFDVFDLRGKNPHRIADYPVNVDWYGAVEFCSLLTSKLGYEVRLPTEWEWQWAAQGPDGRTYPWGKTFDASKCNCHETGIEATPVDAFPQGASPYGVMDLSGNASDWCANEPEKSLSEVYRSRNMLPYRGGSTYSIDMDELKITYRGRTIPAFSLGYGFRIMRVMRASSKLA